MKLKSKRQKFQEEAATAACDVFTGQPCLSEIIHMFDQGNNKG